MTAADTETLRIKGNRVVELESALERMTDLLTGTKCEDRGYSFYSWQRVYQDIEALRAERDEALRKLMEKSK